MIKAKVEKKIQKNQTPLTKSALFAVHTRMNLAQNILLQNK